MKAIQVPRLGPADVLLRGDVGTAIIQTWSPGCGKSPATWAWT